VLVRPSVGEFLLRDFIAQTPSFRSAGDPTISADSFGRLFKANFIIIIIILLTEHSSTILQLYRQNLVLSVCSAGQNG